MHTLIECYLYSMYCLKFLSQITHPAPTMFLHVCLFQIQEERCVKITRMLLTKILVSLLMVMMSRKWENICIKWNIIHCTVKGEQHQRHLFHGCF